MELQPYEKIFWIFELILLIFIVISPLVIFGIFQLKKYLDKKKKQKQILKTLETVTAKLKDERKLLEGKLEKLKQLI